MTRRILTLLLAFTTTCAAQNYTINTIAGVGPALGDGGLATQARFGIVSAVAMAPDGSLYVADAAYHQVRRIGVDGKISLVAGGAVRGFSGDGGPAVAAMLDTPTALSVDTIGNLFIGDSGNHRVREVSIYGNIVTIAGNGQIPPSPSVSPVLPGEGGPATAAPLNQISAITFAANGDIVIADIGNNRVFRIVNGSLKTIAGNATSPASLADQPALPATLSAPSGLATDSQGNIYVSEQTGNVVRKIDAAGKLTLFIGTGSATGLVASGAPLGYPIAHPVGLATDHGFNIYVIESARISRYTPPNFQSGAPASIQVVAGDPAATAGTGDGSPALSAGMSPRSLVVDHLGSIFLADSLPTSDVRNRIRVIYGLNGNNNILAFAGGAVPAASGDKGLASSAQLTTPNAIALDPNGTVYVADTGNNRIRAISADGKINTIAGTGVAGTSGDQGPATAANLNHPQGLALDGNGNLYVSDGNTIRQISSGSINTFAGGGMSTQEGGPALSALLTQTGSLAVDANNNLYLGQFARVSQISNPGALITTVAGTGMPGFSGDAGAANAAQISDVPGVALDSAGNLYIADEHNGRVRKVDSTGVISTFAGGGTSTADGANATDAVLNQPLGVAADSAGNVYIAEFGGNRVRVVNPAGTIRTIAGTSLQGFVGDGGLATNASLSGPSDVKVDAQGNIYIADSLNSAIRKLTPATSAPVPLISSIKSAARFGNGPLAPGQRVILTGTALGPNSQVFFDAVAAPVLGSSFTSTQVVVPYELAGKTSSQVTIKTGGVTSTPFAVQIAPAAPGIYTVSGDGTGQAVAYLGDGSLNSADNATVPGGTIALLCTGEGLVSPAAKTGVLVGSSPPSPVLPVSVMIDGQNADVQGAYSVPGSIGQFLVVASVPDGVGDLSASVQIMVGSSMSQIAQIAVTSGPGSSDGSNLRRPRKQVPGGPMTGPLLR